MAGRDRLAAMRVGRDYELRKDGIVDTSFKGPTSWQSIRWPVSGTWRSMTRPLIFLTLRENYTPQPAAGDYNRRANNPYAQQDDDNRYEMGPLNGQSQGPTNAGGDDLNAFYDEISSIQDSIAQFNNNVQRISDLHSRSLNTMDDQAAAKNNQQLDSLVEETSSLSNQLKMRVKDLERKSGGRDANAKRQQTGAIKQRFLEAIQNYQNVERQYRTKYKQRMERQFKIGTGFV
jgi:syntaxin 1B/2/3